MQRYFFNVRYRDGLIEDEEGSVHADLKAAWSSAVNGVRELIAADVQSGNLDLDQSISILDEAGTVLGEVGFGAVLNVVGSGGLVLHGRNSSVAGAPFLPLDAAMISSLEGMALGAESNAAL